MKRVIEQTLEVGADVQIAGELLTAFVLSSQVMPARQRRHPGFPGKADVGRWIAVQW
jgi:hypothetical protein